jgi:hypothetical protein
MTYEPTPRVAEIMAWCLQKIKSVPYRVTLRWIFYQAYQFFGLTKDDYHNFKSWTSRVRKNFWNGWSPDTLVDDQREILYRGGGYSGIKEWIEALKEEHCILDKRRNQKKIIIICFEAAAMQSQFEHYTEGYYVSLIPFRGDTSIEHKWRIAKWIEKLHGSYNKPIKILYFGDLDKKGLEIPENALNDIRKWCSVPFEFEYIGLKQEHVERWNLPENPEKHGYQWEALDDDAARELIQTAIQKEIDLEAIREIEEEEKDVEEEWKSLVDRMIKTLEDGVIGDDR